MWCDEENEVMIPTNEASEKKKNNKNKGKLIGVDEWCPRLLDLA